LLKKTFYFCGALKIKTQMGKGDKKSKKGKISMGSFGVSRPSKSNLRQAEKLVEKTAAKSKPAKPAAVKAPAAAKTTAPKAAALPKAETAAKPAKKEAAAKK
jgi:ribosomal small subunit protein bTHX